jgi:spore coat protein U-like protein
MKRTLAVLFWSLFFASPLLAITCQWNTVPTPMNFGNYSAFSGSKLTATSSFQIFCTPPGSATLTLSAGGFSAFNPRTMYLLAFPLTTLPYNLYMDAANSIIWGDGTSGTQYMTLTPAAGGTTYNGTIYGSIPPGADVPAGAYANLIQAVLIAGANNYPQNFTVQVHVISDCTVSTNPLNFGSYDPVATNAAAPLDGTTVVNVYCTQGTAATVSLDLGSHATGTTRRMLGVSGDFLTYELYRDAGRTAVWNAASTNGGASTSKNTAINNGFTAYGRIFAGQDVSVGSYSDIVLVTVNY